MRVACPSCSTKRSILFVNHHPHVHALVPAGIMKEAVFHELKSVSSPVIARLFRARLLKVLLDEQTNLDLGKADKAHLRSGPPAAHGENVPARAPSGGGCRLHP